MKKKLLWVVMAWSAMTAFAQTSIIAHRGHWDLAGSAQNSLTALKAADQIGCYGSEFDVHLTSDGVLVVHHDQDIDGIDIQKSPYQAIKGKKLKNGESVPTLAQYLDVGKACATKLILEIKPHFSPAAEDQCVERVLKMVADKRLTDRTEYISFSMHVCEKIKALQPTAKIAYLGGDVAPQDIKARGLTGIDYANVVFALHPDWIKTAHDLGLTVNVWTVNDLNDIYDFVKAGVDYITTNRPVEALKLSR